MPTRTEQKMLHRRTNWALVFYSTFVTPGFRNGRYRRAGLERPESLMAGYWIGLAEYKDRDG